MKIINRNDLPRKARYFKGECKFIYWVPNPKFKDPRVEKIEVEICSQDEAEKLYKQANEKIKQMFVVI